MQKEPTLIETAENIQAIRRAMIDRKVIKKKPLRMGNVTLMGTGQQLAGRLLELYQTALDHYDENLVFNFNIQQATGGN